MNKHEQTMRRAYTAYARSASGQAVWTYNVFAQYAKRHPLWLLKYTTPATDPPHHPTPAQVAEAARVYNARREQMLVTAVMEKEAAARTKRNKVRAKIDKLRAAGGLPPISKDEYNAQDGRILADALAAVMVPEENDRWLRETLGDDAPAPAFTTPACGAEKSSAGEVDED